MRISNLVADEVNMDAKENSSLALEVFNELNYTDEGNGNIQTSASWEHEDLAKVKVRVLRGHKDTVKSCQFCAGATKILTASHDQTIVLWDVASGEAIKRYEGHTAFASQAKANSDGTRFISTGWDKKVMLWDTETGRVLWSGDHGGIVTCGNWSHGDKFIVTGSDLEMALRLWDIGTGALVQTIRGLHKSTLTNAYFSHSDDKIFTTSMDYLSKVWDLKSKVNTITLEGHTNVVSDASSTSNERRLATVSWDKSIRLWDISTGEYRSKGCSLLQKAHEGSISSCDFSKDGSLLVTGGYDQQVLVWDMENMVQKLRLQVTGGYDQQVLVWDMENMVQKLRLQGHLSWVEDVCFSPDQKWILSCGKDATVRLWNIENAENITMVKETNKTIGLRLKSCVQCGKPFSGAPSELLLDNELCVFCRLQSSNKQTMESHNMDASFHDDL